ncbi:MAG TPA: SRPBCC domain-containing protein [Microbacterium sp.]|nr:SRPBCC domain-containing protein [Microbacterium sp.]
MHGAPAETVDADHSTVFTFTLEAVADGTELTVVETGFETTSDPAANLESHREGWNSELDKLVALLEGGA